MSHHMKKTTAQHVVINQGLKVSSLLLYKFEFLAEISPYVFEQEGNESPEEYRVWAIVQFNA